MRALSLILLAVILFISCDMGKVPQETIDIDDVVFDTLRVNVIIFGSDTLTGVEKIEFVDIDDL